MSRRLAQPDLRAPSGDRLAELIGRRTEEHAGRSGRALPSGAAHPRPDTPIAARPEELERLLSAIGDENSHLTAHVRRLETELRRRSVELGKLRGELRGAVQDALTDPLTGLANRRAFDLALAAAGERARSSSPAYLVIADIDHFKRVNDAHGHDHGDEVLRIVGEVLLANVRRESLVARLGGDEFGLLLPGASPREAAGVATRLCRSLASRPLILRDRPEVSERITLSIGVAAWHADEGGDRWYARADQALYHAKRGGRDRIAVDPTAARALPRAASAAALADGDTNRG